MKLVILYMGMILCGYFIASKAKAHRHRFGFVPKLIMGVAYVMVLVMGMKMGINEQVTSNLGIITLKAVVITVFCISGSMLSVFAVRKGFGMNRYGDVCACRAPENQGEKSLEGEEENQESAESALDRDEKGAGFDSSRDEEHEKLSESNNSNLKNTLTILTLVVLGILIGYFAIARFAGAYLPVFDAFSSNLMVVLLCGLLFLVGFDLGLSGSIIVSMKGMGARIMAFPFAAIAGSLAFGTVSAMLTGFSLKEGLAISAGFGWYTYAPTVIADAGTQHMIASAASFMHNVLRETFGLVSIPIMAKKFGYIEAAAIPGVSAMDVCLPIVERSCRQDTVVYSFAIGVAMNIGASVFVPFFINL